MIHYACTAGIAGGRARCRKPQPCPDHPDGQPLAPRPDVILFKVNLNKKWNERFAAAHVWLQDRSVDRGLELGLEHQIQAAELGRSAFAIRPETDDPESADSGVVVMWDDEAPVNGQKKKIILAVDVGQVLEEFLLGGFRMVNIHRLARDWKPPVRLVMMLAKQGESVSYPAELITELTDVTFGEVGIFANPRDRRGNIVHTVNCGRREELKSPVYRLHFSAGDWAAEPIFPAT